MAPIHDAAEAGDSARLSSLLNDPRADPNTKTRWGVTALMFASANGHGVCMALLIIRGADPNEKNVFGTTALMYACHYGHREPMELLITKGARINEKDNRGWTALMWASRKGRRECMELLITKGADTTVMNNDWETAMDVTSNENTREILRRAPLRQLPQRRQTGPAELLAALQPRVSEMEARVTALEAELAKERRALAAEQSARALEREKWGIETCTICHDRATETRFLDCAHSCACDHCAAELRKRGAACPLCRSAIRDVHALVIRAEIRDAAEASGEPPRRRRRR